MRGRFQVEYVFTVSRRGAVAVGDVVDGVIRIGDYTQPLGKAWPDGLKVVGFYTTRAPVSRVRKFGLVLQEIEVHDFERLLPDDRVLVLCAPPLTAQSSWAQPVGEANRRFME